MNKKIYATIFSVIILIGMINITSTSGHTTNNNNSLIDLTNYYAVIVGISDYNGSINDLPSPASEANKMKTVLTQRGWNSENIHLLTNSQATRANILQELEWLGEQEGTVLFYFIGHGTQVKDLDGDEKDKVFPRDEAICPWELTRESLILDDELKIIFDGFKADKTVCIFASCFSGGLIEEDKDDTGKPKPLLQRLRLIDFFPRISRIFTKPLFRNLVSENLVSTTSDQEQYAMYQPMDELQGPNRIIMTAVQENKEAYEFGILGQPFCVLMRQALDGGILGDSKPDKNKDGFISAEEAFDYVQPRAVLENAIGLKAPLAIISAIRAWINGNATIFTVLYVCAVYGIIIPVPQIYDSDPNQEIILTDLK